MSSVAELGLDKLLWLRLMMVPLVGHEFGVVVFCGGSYWFECVVNCYVLFVCCLCFALMLSFAVLRAGLTLRGG